MLQHDPIPDGREFHFDLVARGYAVDRPDSDPEPSLLGGLLIVQSSDLENQNRPSGQHRRPDYHGRGLDSCNIVIRPPADCEEFELEGLGVLDPADIPNIRHCD